MIGTNTNLANAIGTTDRLARQTVSAVAARVLPTSRHSPRKVPHPFSRFSSDQQTTLDLPLAYDRLMAVKHRPADHDG